MPSSSPKRTALLTGASGFTGRYLAAALSLRGYHVARMDSSGVQPCDLTDRKRVAEFVATESPDVVVHLAAVSFVAHDKVDDFYRVNVIGTLNLLESLAKLERVPKRIIVASSGHVYGTPDVEVLDESLCPAPINHYACSKLAMEYLVRTWYERLPILITRPFNYTGPGQADHFLVPKIVKHFKKRAPFIELGNLHVSRDYSDVEDVVAIYLALLEGDARSEVVNICSGRAIALLDIISMMRDISGHDIEVKVNPEFVRKNEVPRLLGSTAKLQSLADIPPARPFHETLERMYEQMGEVI
jgi:GDP-6-deoxy-D-talose 4-dehydrogenase